MSKFNKNRFRSGVVLFFKRASERRQLPPDLVDVLNQQYVLKILALLKYRLQYLHPSRDPSFYKNLPHKKLFLVRQPVKLTYLFCRGAKKVENCTQTGTILSYTLPPAGWPSWRLNLAARQQEYFDHNKDRSVRVAKYHKGDLY